MTEALLRAPAPVFKVDGQVKGELARDVQRIDIEESCEGLKTFRGRFVAQGAGQHDTEERLLYFDGEILDFGRTLEVTLGGEGEERALFSGAVSALEFSYEEGKEPELVVCAEDKLMALRMTRRMKTYKNVSDADLAREVASQHGLRADVAADGPSYDVVHQLNQSDLAFLRDRARLVQAELWLEGDALCFKSRRQRRPRTELNLVRGNQLLEVQVRADLAHQRTKVKVSGYDARQAGRIEEEAGADAIAPECERGANGPDTLRRALGERVSYRVREVPLAGAEARAWAREEMARRARAFVTVTGTTDGTPDLVVGSHVSLEGVGRPFEGPPYVVTRVVQQYDLESGHRTRFEAERPTISEATR